MGQTLIVGLLLLSSCTSREPPSPKHEMTYLDREFCQEVNQAPASHSTLTPTAECNACHLTKLLDISGWRWARRADGRCYASDNPRLRGEKADGPVGPWGERPEWWGRLLEGRL